MTENNQAMKTRMESIPFSKRTAGQHLTYRLFCMEELLNGLKVTKTVLHEWGQHLKGFSVADIEYAFKGLSCGKFFPSITEFRKLAKISYDVRFQKLEAERRRLEEEVERKRTAADPDKRSVLEAKKALQGEGDLGKGIFALWFKHKISRMPPDANIEDAARLWAKDLQAFFITHKLKGYDYDYEYQSRKQMIVMSRKSMAERTGTGKPMPEVENDQLLLKAHEGD